MMMMYQPFSRVWYVILSGIVLSSGGRPLSKLPNRSLVTPSSFFPPDSVLKAQDCLECQCYGGSDVGDLGTQFGG